MMTVVEKVKHEGQKKALRDHISRIQFQLRNNWEDAENSEHYTRLQQAIENGRSLLSHMEEALTALIELDGRNR